MVYSSLVNIAHAMLVITSLEHILNDPPPPPPPPSKNSYYLC